MYVERLRQLLLPLLVLLLAAVSVALWYESFQVHSPGIRPLRIAFLAIGQGDAIYIESPTGTQVVVDGGPDSSLLRELAGVMGPFDRTIDAIVVTNPDKDHFGGFIDAASRYTIGKEFESGTYKDTVTYHSLERALEDHKVQRLLARRGMILDLGGGAQLNVLYPDRDVTNLKSNDGSVVMELAYGSTTVMLMGDATAFVEYHLLTQQKVATSTLHADILKLGHHGSKTSSTANWLKAVAPKEAIVSAGCHNSYGHPSPETLARLASAAIPYLWTCKEGTIEFDSDGVAWTRK